MRTRLAQRPKHHTAFVEVRLSIGTSLNFCSVHFQPSISGLRIPWTTRTWFAESTLSVPRPKIYATALANHFMVASLLAMQSMLLGLTLTKE